MRQIMSNNGVLKLGLFDKEKKDDFRCFPAEHHMFLRKLDCLLFPGPGGSQWQLTHHHHESPLLILKIVSIYCKLARCFAYCYSYLWYQCCYYHY